MSCAARGDIPAALRVVSFGYMRYREIVDATAIFEHMGPDILMGAVEHATGLRLTGLTIPLPSYINRVYEFQSTTGERLIAKFYRPGRWDRAALKEEHEFLRECAASEIAVVAPRAFVHGETLGQVCGVDFAVFPKRAGREFEPVTDEDWLRIGSLVGRIHLVGGAREAPSRIRHHPAFSTARELEALLDFVTPESRGAFEDICRQTLAAITPLFEGIEYIRLHGDCHRANLLDRLDEGLLVIDFDDMMMGPPVQDLWLLLPDHATRSRRELGLILEGYRQFRDLEYASLRLIEPLRFMRIIYYLAWCSKQVHDVSFQGNHPDWGSEIFWQRETADLAHQFQVIMEHLVEWEEGRFVL